MSEDRHRQSTDAEMVCEVAEVVLLSAAKGIGVAIR